jgi:hypothetical protein
MVTFTGARTIDGLDVLADGEPLTPRTDIKQFTNRGFEWTYEGVEPTQLALAILARHLDDDQAALAQCDGFMRLVIANLDNDWTLSGPEINAALAKIKD